MERREISEAMGIAYRDLGAPTRRNTFSVARVQILEAEIVKLEERSRSNAEESRAKDDEIEILTRRCQELTDHYHKQLSESADKVCKRERLHLDHLESVQADSRRAREEHGQSIFRCEAAELELSAVRSQFVLAGKAVATFGHRTVKRRSCLRIQMMTLMMRSKKERRRNRLMRMRRRKNCYRPPLPLPFH
jgi:hypothetical protein